MDDKSLWTIHEEWVKELLQRGEKVLQPKTGNPHGSIWGYVKIQVPHKDAGIIHKNEEDGTFEILCDMCQYEVNGLRIEDIGLCDAKCWYEWANENKCGEDDRVENRSECYRSNLRNVKIGDLIEELLSRDGVTSQTIPWGKRFPDLSHDGWNIRTGPAKIIIIRDEK